MAQDEWAEMRDGVELDWVDVPAPSVMKNKQKSYIILFLMKKSNIHKQQIDKPQQHNNAITVVLQLVYLSVN